MKRYTKGVFLFRRDLRIIDNTALNNALKECNEVLCIFVFDNEQKDHQYFSYNGFDFMIESLLDLRTEIENKDGILLLLKGELMSTLKEIIIDYKPVKIYFNQDYTPFSLRRDNKIIELCNNLSVKCESYNDILIAEPYNIKNINGKPYTIFTPFYNALKKMEIKDPITYKGTFSKYHYKKEITMLPKKYDISKKRNIFGGRQEAIRILNKIREHDNYNKIRDYPIMDGTTKLSAHFKFGTISVREAHRIISLELGIEHPLIRQIAWREFYYHIAVHNPHVFGNEFRKEYTKIEWDYNLEKLDAWKKGVTGFPIVDAGMRELLETGYMHNRVRMITASFLTKDLHIDWRLGEKHFAKYLVDYDPCVNNGNWQWAASTGCDAQPYFRIFNPWLQQKKFDELAEYIKKWIPELKDYESKKIHTWYENYETKKYPKPILEHDVERKISLERFKKA